MHDQQFTCAGCSKPSPPTNDGETITKRHAWRLTRRVEWGTVIVESRCPECWVRYRASLPPTVNRRPPGGGQ